MYEKYYLNKNQQLTGEHEVHIDNRTCPTPPLLENRIPLGSFFSCSEAVKFAKEKYKGVIIDGCKNCIPACHTR